MRVLLVEDEMGIAQFIMQGLKEVGYIINRAENRQSGRDLADAYEYDTDGYHKHLASPL